MRVMVIVKATEASEQGLFAPEWTASMMAAMGAFNDDLRAAGVLVMAEGLQPSAQGKRILCDGEARTVADGPFAPAESLVAGFWLWEVRDMDEALAWAKRCPNPMPVPSVIEIRPLN
ncbi:MAG: YciI family protein [Polymorphobacter sp.]|uniref:YciI family protein n=1 Tax=Polymorphobacter sp. TaxID=1909290 RepID=UPI003A87854F